MLQAQPWVDGLLIGQVLRRRAEQQPDPEALVFPQYDYRASYAEYDRQVDAAACGLLGMGIGRGDHVAIWATNRPEWVILSLATSRIGAVLVTVNPAYRTHELRYVLEQSDARALFLIDSFKTSDYFSMLGECCPELSVSEPGRIASAALPKLDWVVSIGSPPRDGMIDWAGMLERGESIEPAALLETEGLLDPNQPINLQYTSGTTGFPKGVLLSHRNLLLNAYYVGFFQKLTKEDRVCVPVPFYHCFGTVIGTLCCMVHGAAMLVPGEYYEPEAVLDCVEKERATSVYGVPTMFIGELEHPTFEGRNLSALRTGIMAGSPCPIEVMNRVIGDMGAKQMTIAYGLTECSPAITQTLTDDPVELRVSTVGKVIPGVEVKIADPESGAALPDGAQGELCARGHNVMIGYYKMPEATASAIREGWLHSGDLAIRDSDGYVRITGRIKDMIIRGGENVYPREIEEFLFTHPKIESVQVVGVPDARLGEELCAWIKLRAGEQATTDEMRAFCKGKLAHFKIPRYVDFVDEFPLTVTGKVQKFKIREQAIERLGLEEEVAG